VLRDDPAVLLIDDTWTTGGNAQSAALALRAAGAAKVAAVVIGRHFDRRFRNCEAYLSLPRAGSQVPLTAVIAGHPGGGPGRRAGSPVMPRFLGAAGRLFP
jgi:orotate phosphoribosyltransferase